MNITEAIEKIFGVVKAVQEATSEDSPGGKKITLVESIGLAIQGIGLIPAVTAFSTLIEDWKTRDAEKKQEWIQAFNENFDLPDDELERQIENLVSTLLILEGSFNLFAQNVK